MPKLFFTTVASWRVLRAVCDQLQSVCDQFQALINQMQAVWDELKVVIKVRGFNLKKFNGFPDGWVDCLAVILLANSPKLG